MFPAIHQLSRLLLYMSKSFLCNRMPIRFCRRDMNQKEGREVPRFLQETSRRNMQVYKILEYADDFFVSSYILS